MLQPYEINSGLNHKMTHIFISYSRKDLAIAEKIINALAKDDLEPWIDWKSIPKGETFEREIQQGIEKAEIFLLLVSPDSVQSDWCNKEIAHAVKNGKRILPVVIRDTDLEDIHPEISKRNWIFCREELDDFDKAIGETHKAIQTDYEWLKYHTKLLVKSLDWELRGDNSLLLRGKNLKEVEQRIAEVSNKVDPQLTSLQQRYILSSRREEERRRNLTLTISIVVSVLMIILGVYAQIQGKLATSQAALARAASTQAIEQRNIAFSRQLAAQAEDIRNRDPNFLPLSILLAVESLDTRHAAYTNDGRQTLLNTLSLFAPLVVDDQLNPPEEIMGNDITQVAISPDGQKVAFVQEGGVISVWNINEWKETRRIMSSTTAGTGSRVRLVSFCLESDLLISGTDSGIVQVWNLDTGQEIAKRKYNDQVFVVACSPNSEWVISGEHKMVETTGEIDVWDIATGQEIYSVVVDSSINLISMSQDGSTAAVAGDKQITVWSVETGVVYANILHPLSDDPYALDGITAIALSQDGKYVASGDGYQWGTTLIPRTALGGNIIVWSTGTGEKVISLEQDDEILDMEFNPDGTQLLTGSYDGSAVDWSLRTGEKISELKYGTPVRSVAYTNLGKWALATGDRGTIQVWDVARGWVVKQLVSEKQVVITSLDVTEDGHFVVAGDNEGKIRAWEMIEQERFFVNNNERFAIASVAFDPESERLVAGGWDNVVRTWTTDTGKQLPPIFHNDKVLSVAISPDGNYGASASADGIVKIWDPTTSKEIAELSQLRNIGSIAFSPDSKFLAISEGIFPRFGWFFYMSGIEKTTRASVIIWDLSTMKPYREFYHSGWVNSLAFDNSGRLLITGGDDQKAVVWDVQTGEALSSTLHDERVNTVAFSPNGKWVASLEACFPLSPCRPVLKIWDPLSGTEKWNVVLPGNWPSDLTFSVDSKFVIVADNFVTSCGDINAPCPGGSVYVFDVDGGQLLIRKPHEGLVNAFALSPDGTYVASGGGSALDQDGKGGVQIWEISTGETVLSIPFEEPWSAAFSSNEKYIAIGGFATEPLQVLPISFDDWIDLACDRSNRNLSFAEWTKYFGDEPYRRTCPDLPGAVVNPNGNAGIASLSSNGDLLVFSSNASNMLCNDINFSSDVFLLKRDFSDLTAVSKTYGGVLGNGDSFSPSISADGRYVVFSSLAKNLLEATNGVSQIFLYDSQKDDLSLISHDPKGEPGNDNSSSPFISANGNFIVFESHATNLAATGGNGTTQIYLYDIASGNISLVSLAPDGSPADGDATSPSVSADGQLVLFESYAENLLANGIGNESPAFIYDQRTGLVSALIADMSELSYPVSHFFNEYFYDVKLSADGQYAVGNIVIEGSGSLNEWFHDEIFYYNRHSGEFKIISTSANGSLGDMDSASPKISTNGRFIVFSSEATNLVSDDLNIAWDIFVFDVELEKIIRVSTAVDGAQPNGNSFNPTISGDGRYVTFTSLASNLVTGDTNGLLDIFLFDTKTGVIERIIPLDICKE
ncbi:MAG: TIR domain-containing protein [Anaerolineales bacterium]|nr:TIR domain-containing protein [Anaerolineales bacterium]